MFAKPQSEHEWLGQLVGRWTFEHDCQMPDGSTATTQGTMNCRLLGAMWLICESSGESPDGGAWSSIMTVGFDPALQQYVGTFVGSMMANIWPYLGVLDATGKRLPLNSEGPAMVGRGTCKYRDTIEIIDANSWMFLSEFQGENGEWHQFLSGMHRRD